MSSYLNPVVEDGGHDSMLRIGFKLLYQSFEGGALGLSITGFASDLQRTTRNQASAIV